jgi:hypothetical protein
MMAMTVRISTSVKPDDLPVCVFIECARARGDGAGGTNICKFPVPPAKTLFNYERPHARNLLAAKEHNDGSST